MNRKFAFRQASFLTMQVSPKKQFLNLFPSDRLRGKYDRDMRYYGVITYICT